jgi:hypothetical protein
LRRARHSTTSERISRTDPFLPYVACYEPSRLCRATPDGRLGLLIDDPEAHTLCHPTNCAFRGTDLFTANLGRWHVTRIDAGIEGLPLL